MIEIGPTPAETDQSPTNAPAGHDFSVLQGFQVVGAEDRLAAQKATGEDAWRDAVRLNWKRARPAFIRPSTRRSCFPMTGSFAGWEIRSPGSRPARMCWPRKTVIFADESLPEASQDIVRTRIDLWLSATIRRLVGPLLALESLQEGSELVRDLAGRLARSLGILERETIRSQVKALTQNERAELRKQGVRFGAYYIFIPALIKPAPKNPRPSPVEPSGGRRRRRAGESAGSGRVIRTHLPCL